MLFANNYYFDRLRREMDELFSGLAHSSEFPPVNLYSKEHELVLTAEIPGLEAEDLDISSKDNILTIRGERKSVELSDDQTYIKRERSCGKFSRAFSLPRDIDSDKIEAKYKNGVLILRLPIAEAAKPRKINVSGE
ncbi:Hsp20/alpha crystallin family protein [Lentisphaerota bacterium ZTH]|nr:Hsp20/alpha crystallin family protein [Lentisphaerota bacterium]WET07267.1 Hsp20/alpha crystallin family protein [Lentisphaerota bacterium ZTH]